MPGEHLVTAWSGLRVLVTAALSGAGIGGTLIGSLFFSQLRAHEEVLEDQARAIAVQERRIAASEYRQLSIICLLRHLAGTGDRSPQQCQDDYDAAIANILRGTG